MSSISSVLEQLGFLWNTFSDEISYSGQYFFCVAIQKKQKLKCTLRFLSQKNCTFFWKRLRNKNRAATARKCNCLDLTFEQIRVETDCSNSFGVTFVRSTYKDGWTRSKNPFEKKLSLLLMLTNSTFFRNWWNADSCNLLFEILFWRWK